MKKNEGNSIENKFSLGREKDYSFRVKLSLCKQTTVNNRSYIRFAHLIFIYTEKNPKNLNIFTWFVHIRRGKRKKNNINLVRKGQLFSVCECVDIGTCVGLRH